MPSYRSLICFFCMSLLLNIGHAASFPAFELHDTIYRVAFYNVENLFDTEDDPEKIDEEFTPLSRNKYTVERYMKKLEHLDKVIAAMGYPDILGLAEVENATVLNDLINTTGMATHQYQAVHFESPDRRGIDVALLIKKSSCKLVASNFTRIDFPNSVTGGEDNYTSRDILHAEIDFLGKERLHIFVNHWPSRYGGMEESEPKRMHVARYLRRDVNELQQQNPDAKIIIIGDFNDEPDNKSISEVLGALLPEDSNFSSNKLYNLMAKLDICGQGTYNYRGNWTMIDQIIVSGNLMEKKATFHMAHPEVFLEMWMMFKHPEYNFMPNRTYGGSNYYGGYSDHLPVMAEIVRN